MDLLERVFETKNVKIFSTIIEDEDGTPDMIPYFCARDVCNVCNVLEYSNYRDALYTHIKDECKMSLKKLLGVCQIQTPRKVKYNHNELQQVYIKNYNKFISMKRVYLD